MVSGSIVPCHFTTIGRRKPPSHVELAPKDEAIKWQKRNSALSIWHTLRNDGKCQGLATAPMEKENRHEMRDFLYYFVAHFFFLI
jgi:hypothetical protein